MNNHVGYTFYGDHNEPPNGFSTIDITQLKETTERKHLFDPDYDADF